MKRSNKFIVAPMELWTSPQLTWPEKCALIEIDSVTTDVDGAPVNPQTLATLMNITRNEAKEILNSLFRKGGIEYSIDVDGKQYTKAFLYKEDYSDVDKSQEVENKPTASANIDYDYIQEQWNAINPELAELTRFTPQRKKRTRTALKNANLTVADLIKCFRIIANSRFLQGGNNINWRATYDWLVKSPENITKVYEGSYTRDVEEQKEYTRIINDADAEPIEDSVYK